MQRSKQKPLNPSKGRRRFLQQAAGVLPFALVIPSRSGEVITSEDRLRPFREREMQFREQLRSKLAQGTVGPGIGPRPPPPPPQPRTINTLYDTSQNTTVRSPEDTSTRTGQSMDDSNVDYINDTVYDGTKSDYKTDDA